MTRWQANLCLLMTAAIWGSTFAIQHVAMDTIGPMTFTAIRFLLGALVVSPFALREWKQLKREVAAGENQPMTMGLWAGFVITGLCLFLGAYIQQYGIIYTSVTNAGFLTALYVLFVPLLGVIMFRRRVHWSVWPAGLSCLSGAAILSGLYGSLLAGEDFDLNIGDLWVIVSAVFWALHVLFVAIFGQRVGKPALFAFVQFVTVGVVGSLIMFTSEQIDLTALWDAKWMFAFAGFISVGVGFTCQVIGQRYTGPADAAIIISMETVFAVIAGMTFLGESLDLLGFVGCYLIFQAVMLVELTPMLTRGWRKRWGKPIEDIVD